MITVLIVFALYYGVISLLDIPFMNKIIRSKSVEDSLKARKLLRVIRPIISVILIIVFCVIVAVINVYNGDEKLLGQRIGMIIGFAILVGWARMRGNVQANSKDEYIAKHKNKGFVLYLRAFESDFYSKDPKARSFEGSFIKALESRGRDVCAIGMTKELDAPYGAERVYVSDESWQSDVKELMQYADTIFILMSDRQSCIWEIAQSADKLQKTYFIIDNESKYVNVKDELRELICFPEFNEMLKIADERERWEQKGRNSEIGMKEKLNNGSVRLGLMLNNNSYKALIVEDMVAFINEVFERSDNELLNIIQHPKKYSIETIRNVKLELDRRNIKQSVVSDDQLRMTVAEFALASPIARFLAFAIDVSICSLISYYVLSMIGVNFSYPYNSSFFSYLFMKLFVVLPLGPLANLCPVGTGIEIVSTIVFLVYFIVFEILVGRTFGKMVMGLRVVSIEGKRPSVSAFFIRLVCRFIPLIDAVSFIPSNKWEVGPRPFGHLHDNISHTYVVSMKRFRSYYADKLQE